MKKPNEISGLLLALLIGWGGAQAAGLGKLDVQSALGQPLRAEIELLSVSQDDLANLSARLAGLDAYRQARIERQDALGNLRFSVDRRANGQPVVRITSTTPVADPYLELLVELNWATGRLIREYTVLLDPPKRVAPAEAPPRMAPPVAQAATPVEAPRTRPAAPDTPPTPERYGPVRAGETLRGIAGRVKPADVTLEQMMLGLYQANPQAFQGNNMNRLNRGAVLRVPDADAARAHTQGEALRTLRSHGAEWQAYRRQVAETAALRAPTAITDDAAAGRIAPRRDEAAPPPAPAQDVLRLSKGEPGVAGRPDAKTLEKIQSLEEELAAKARALKEAQERVDQLERTVLDMQKLLELKAQEAAAPPPVAVAPEPPPPPPVAAVPPPAPAAQPAPAPLVSSLPPPDSSSSWFATFIGNPLYIGGLVAAVLLSGLLWMMMVGSRRRQGLTKFEDSIMTGGELKNSAVFTAPPAGPPGGAATEGSMLLTDFSRLGMGAIDSHEVDPIAEAEVYMAYGRDAQAEEILKEALGKDPGRHEISLKLLEIYAARKDTIAFETAASELYAALGGQNTPVWQRAAEMGRTIDAENPLYRVAAPSAAAGAPAAAPSVAPTAVAAAGAAAVTAAAAAAVAAPIVERAARAEPGPMADLDAGFDLPGFEDKIEAPGAATQPPASPPEPTDWSNDLDFAPVEAAPAPQAEPEPLTEAADFGLDFPSTPVETQPEPAPESVDMDATLVLPGDEAELLEFDLAPPVPATGEAPPKLDLSGIDLELDTAPEPPVTPLDEPLAVDDFATDIELGVPAEAAQAMPERGLDFALPAEEEGAAPDFGALEAEAPLAAEPLPEPVPEFEAEALAVPPEASAFEQAAGTPAAGEEAFDAELREEVETKLDLARAYLEMGDHEGAREILQEVMGEGDSAQKAEAQKLLADAA